MDNDAIAYLEQIAIDAHIKVMWSDILSPITPPACSVETRKVMMNSRWHKVVDLPFQLAHELSHVINGDETDLMFYNASFTGKSSVEYKANVGAVKLLVPYYCENTEKENANVYDFENNYDVPSYLSSVVGEQIREYYTKQITSKY